MTPSSGAALIYHQSSITDRLLRLPARRRLPWPCYFTALDIRLPRTWRTRRGSVGRVGTSALVSMGSVGSKAAVAGSPAISLGAGAGCPGRARSTAREARRPQATTRSVISPHAGRGARRTVAEPVRAWAPDLNLWVGDPAVTAPAIGSVGPLRVRDMAGAAHRELVWAPDATVHGGQGV